MTAPSLPMTYAVSAETRVGGQAVAQARMSTFPFDGSARAGDALPGPADLRRAALCACVLISPQGTPLS